MFKNMVCQVPFIYTPSFGANWHAGPNLSPLLKEAKTAYNETVKRVYNRKGMLQNETYLKIVIYASGVSARNVNYDRNTLLYRPLSLRT